MEHTAKHFALQLGALISLYVSLTSAIVLVFGVINLMVPDAAASIWETEGAMSSIRFSIATLVVFFPVYLWLTRVVNQMRRTGDGSYLALTKWLIYLSLLAGGLVLLGNFVSVIYTFLNGELTTRFLLKALSLFVIVGSAFTYYLLDARGHWQKNEKKSVQFGAAAAVLAVAMIVVGYMQIQGPNVVREMRIDENQLTDLQDMQWRIEEYVRLESSVPSTLEEVYDGMEIPTAPEGRTAYRYEKTDRGFNLCAHFAHETTDDQYGFSKPYATETGAVILNPNNWEHPVGEYCFERVVSLSNAPSATE